MPQFTLTLDERTTQRIRETIETFGGSIPSFAASLARDVSRLPVEEIQRIRREISDRVRVYEIAKEIHEKGIQGKKPL